MTPTRQRIPSQDRGAPIPLPLVVQYMGFQAAPGRREYLLVAQAGDTVRTYTVSIPLEAFAHRHALLQDGPDICYQRLLRAFADHEPIVAGRLVVTNADLRGYRDAHARPVPAPRRAATPSSTPALAFGADK
ncbi:MAG TPA: hypothetical protein VFQ51_01690 [Vicinamibacteria bacterium]|nr:hypothetical protein [Vicinamibacteria bacterium]